MFRTALAAVLLTALAAFSLLAQTEQPDVKKTVGGTVELEKETQQKRDDWAAEKADLTARYRTARANVDYLLDRKAVEGKRLSALQEAIADLERRLGESDRLNASLQDSLNAVVSRLEGWVDRDLPFLLEEREARVANLKNEIARPDVTGAEKLRRVLEALMIEAQYGGTVEVHQESIELMHQESIDVASEELFVDILRIGRISVFWRTPDGRRAGEFDQGAGQWVELDGKYNRNIGMAMEMATRIRPVELISLPLGRIVP
jgi:predicted RNase H-like nuclease (RuvC/YqgF family)